VKNFIILRTDKGGRYARKIMRSIRWLNNDRYSREDFHTEDVTIGEFVDLTVRKDGRLFLHDSRTRNQHFSPQDTIIHARCANPRTTWTEQLRELEQTGYTVVNSVDAIELTSNKLACALHLQNVVPHPRSWEYDKDVMRRNNTEHFYVHLTMDEGLDTIIAKPLTSLSQGAHVRKLGLERNGQTVQEMGQFLMEQFDRVPGNKIVVQEFFPYTAMHRVIVIGGHALPYTFVDRVSWHPREWKVSCCLNRTSMRIDTNPSMSILEIAERTQRAVNGEINFIDIFENEQPGDGSTFAISEINTACSLNIHERLAQEAGRTDWNIHYRIAKHLVKKMMGD
jgi:glutathione synthase/RimK-type ligase-like ATP-grasp enzyme